MSSKHKQPYKNFVYIQLKKCPFIRTIYVNNRETRSDLFIASLDPTVTEPVSAPDREQWDNVLTLINNQLKSHLVIPF